MSLNLASSAHISCSHFPGETALIHDDRKLSYNEFLRHLVAFAAHLRQLGVQPGDKVALFCPNRMSFTIAYYGILQAGGTVVPISYLAVGREVGYYLNDSDAVALVAWSEYSKAAREGFDEAEDCEHLLLFDEGRGPLTMVDSPGVDPDGECDLALTSSEDTAVILYTSGTTGQPKGAELTHFNMYSNAQFCSEQLLGEPGRREIFGPGDVSLSALPLFHSFGQTSNQNSSIMGGAALSYLERFDPEAALEVMERDRVTQFAGVPTMYFALLNFEGAERYDLSSLKYCYSGGAPMPVEVLKDFDRKYNVSILEGYGLSETSPVATFNLMYRPRKIGSIGLAISGCEVKVVDGDDNEVPPGEVGEIAIRGYNVMKGYYKRPEATEEAFRGGWFHTGDMGTMDEDEYFFIVDRKKDLILRGGFNVYPREVEEVLYSHSSIREAAVIGVPDEKYGEEVKAFVSLKEGCEVSLDELLEFSRERLSASKYPRLFEILDDLPKGSTGKILRKSLRANGDQEEG
ncbi:MAG TPA: long-chain-fatty-acid--CoA ligase [Planctomycetes bacterium]|nr:long-chain-fatty-acid--CoA ligase [Planctomycetota bacterium]